MAGPTSRVPSESTPPRRPGRPRQEDQPDDVRQQLIRAATQLFTTRGYGEVGVRQVAAAAGVTPAMVSYYFGDKQGLYEAMIESVFQNLVERAKALANRADGEEDRLSAFVRMHIETMAAEPWTPQLILREVLSAEGPLRERFINDFGTRMRDTVLALVGEGIETGELRSDLDPKLVMLSLMGLCVFPFLTHPVSGRLLGHELDDDFRDRLTEHTVRLLRAGLFTSQAQS